MPCIDSSEKAVKSTWKITVGVLIHKACSVEQDMSCNLINFSFAKRGVLCASNLAKLIIRIVLFCKISNGLIFEQCVLPHTMQSYVRKGYTIA